MNLMRSFGIARVQRHIGAAGFENSQQPNHHLDRALDADADQLFWADTEAN